MSMSMTSGSSVAMEMAASVGGNTGDTPPWPGLGAVLPEGGLVK